MTDINESSNLNCARWEMADLGNCNSCNKTLEIPFYRNYHNEYNGEHYKSGPITSKDELSRYEFLARCKPSTNGIFEEMSYVKKETLCLGCYKDKETKVNAVQLHLMPDSTNAALENYLSGLPDLSGLPEVNFGYGPVGNGFDIIDDLNTVFAEENVKFDDNAQQTLDDIRNNFIKDKCRRYPNDNELSRWMQARHPEISHCKIFDMRGLDYIRDDVTRRFVVIVHLQDQVGWWVLYLPAKVIRRHSSPVTDPL